VLLLADVEGSSCFGYTIMYASLDGVPEGIQPADECTLNHVYYIHDESPIILMLEDGFPRLTGPEVSFDLSNCGTPQILGWTEPDAMEGFLVLDRNNDGRITSGAEMFGNYTPVGANATPEYLAVNGFQALAAFDDPVNGGNGDGWMTAADRAYRALRLWIDTDHNGISDSWELHPLQELGIEGIYLSPRPSSKRDQHGNEMRYVAPFLLRTADGKLVERRAVDVFCVQQ
jgi:hypothetical protein